MIENLTAFVRAYPIPKKKDKTGTRRRVELGPSPWSITFDTETTIDAAQRFRVGSFQIRYGDLVIVKGLFYDPEALTPRELRTLVEYAEDSGCQLLELEEWIRNVFLYYAYDLTGLIVGFNLRFDISRIAHGHFRSGGDGLMQGGFTFRVGDKRIQIKPAGTKSTFFRFSQTDGRTPEQRNRDAGGNVANFTGYFLDVSQLATALLSQSLRLGDLADLLETPTRKGKVDDFGAEITPEFLDYAFVDSQVTWETYTALRDRYEALQLSRPIWKIVSEASIGKAHLAQIGLKPWQTVDTAFPDWLKACLMETYFGGRTECRIRRVATPGVYVDYLSEYPTVYTLQGLWDFQIAQSVTWHDEDPQVVTAMLEGLTPDDVLDPVFWKQLHWIVLIEPDGDRLPTRSTFGPDSTLNVAIAYRAGGPAGWYTLADAVASVLETGRVPKIVRAIRFEPGPPQPGLQPLKVGDIEIDPYREDLIRRFIEIRRQLKQQARTAKSEADLLTARQLALKTTANAVAYGIGIEMNTNDYTKPREAVIAKPGRESFTISTRRIETQGEWFHPLIATLTAAGGRLLIALLMRLVRDAGGEFVFTDTDSLLIAATTHGGTHPCPEAPNGQIRILSWAQVDEIIGRFEALNPYDFGGSILELEDENYIDGEQVELWCWSIASKRYALYHVIDGRVVLATNDREEPKRSEHGLGHLINPAGRDIDWISQWWTHLIATQLGLDSEPPTWLTNAAIGRLPVSSHHELRAFKAHNKGRPYPEQVRPFGFLLMAHLNPIVAAAKNTPRSLVSGYERDPDQWTELTWFDRANPQSSDYRIRTNDPYTRIPGELPVQTLGDYFDTYRTHPDTKTADSEGTPCRRRTRGLLQPRSIEATEIIRVGKEHDRLTEGPLEDHHRAQRYTEPKCQKCSRLLTGRQRQWCSDQCRMQHTRGAV